MLYTSFIVSVEGFPWEVAITFPSESRHRPVRDSHYAPYKLIHNVCGIKVLQNVSKATFSPRAMRSWMCLRLWVSRWTSLSVSSEILYRKKYHLLIVGAQNTVDRSEKKEHNILEYVAKSDTSLVLQFVIPQNRRAVCFKCVSYTLLGRILQ